MKKKPRKPDAADRVAMATTGCSWEEHQIGHYESSYASRALAARIRRAITAAVRADRKERKP